MPIDRRNFMALAAAGACSSFLPAGAVTSPLTTFKLGSITDEWTQDFEAALKAMRGYGLHWVEVRTLWGKYNTDCSPAERRKMKALVDRYGFKVSVLDTGVFKCALPGTKPVGREKDIYPYAAQTDQLKRGIENAHLLGTGKVRVFSFYRVGDPAPLTPRIADELMRISEIARSGGVRLVLENESECNVATGHESARMMKAARAENLGMNWDTGNGYWQGEVSYPDGYGQLDKSRIWHMHLKDVRCTTDARGGRHCRTVVVGTGVNDLVGQLRASLHDKFDGTMSLEPEVEAPGLSHLEATERSLTALLKDMRRV
jgi:L-ribulose-5-phosphate 3-epimerase